MDAHYIGIDVSKDRLDVHAHPSGETFAVARNGEGLAQLVVRLQAIAPALIAVEATGGFETVVAASLASAALPVVVVNPAPVRHYAQALGKRAKTDPIDAAVIARFVEATQPEVRVLPDEATQLLADLVARRRQIVEMMAAEGQRERRAAKRLQKASPGCARRSRRTRRTRRRDRRSGARLAGLGRKEDLLASVPGVGSIIAPHADRRNAGTRNARPPSDRSARGASAVDATVRPVEGQRASSAAVARPCAACCLSAPWSPRDTTRPLKRFRDKLVAAGKSNGSPSSPSPESC